MKISTIQKMINKFQEIFNQLDINVPLNQIEKIATIVHKSMSLSSRTFHTPDHIFNLMSCDDPIKNLAALFHDIIYYQVDHGFPPDLENILVKYIKEEKGEIFITKNISNDELFQITLKIFGFHLGEKLSPFGGLNEFLSTLVMNSQLKTILPLNILAKIITSIEATIPFRDKNDLRETFGEQMTKKLTTVNECFKLNFDSQEIEECIKSAVIFSNRDVEGFADPSIGNFLDNTWKLLPETNPILKSVDIYSIIDYRISLQKMEGFFSFLNPATVFKQYKNTPDDQEFMKITDYAFKNILTARDYLGIKLVTMAVLESIAEISGGADVPISLFMGEIKHEGQKVKRLEDYLPSCDSSNCVDSLIIYELLYGGRSSEVSFDMKNSPLSSYLYKKIGLKRIRELLPSAKEMFNHKISAPDFLNIVDSQVVQAVAKACGEMVETRKKQLMKICNEYNLDKTK